MGDHADDALNAAYDDAHRYRNSRYHPQPYDARFKTGREVQAEIEAKLTRLQKKSKE